MGELFSILSALAWACGVILYRRLGESLPPLTLNFLKNVLVLGMLLPLVPLLHGFAWPAMGAGEVAIALGSGFIGIALADTLYFRALNELGASRMGIIGNLYSPFVIVLSFLFLGERLGLLQLAGFVLVSAGVLLIARPAAREPAPAGMPLPAPVDAPDAALAPRAPHPLRGVLLAVLAVGLMAIAIVMVKRVLETQPLLWVTLVRMLGALLGLVLLAALRGELGRLRPPRTPVDWRMLALAAFVGQCLAMVLWLAGYKYTQASIAAILNETASVFILLLAWLWLREPIGRRGVFGVCLTLGGVALMLG
jgi:drug/metabolite transporter (DMT)-like permease